MKKRFLSLLCVLALCLGLLPVTALAVGEDAPAKLYVGDQSVRNGENTTYWTTNDSGGLTQSSENDAWSVKYEPGTATLTLRNATIKTTHDNSQGAVIYAESRSSSAVSLTIELEGTNTIDSASYGIFVNAEMSNDSYGTSASLTITGNGSLEVSGSSHGIYVKSGTGDASLNINDASVVAKTTQTYSGYAGVFVSSSTKANVSPNLSLAVNGGSLTANGGTSSDGILFNVVSSQATGATTSLTVSENAIVDARNGGISASRISETLPTPTPTGDNSSGIVFDDKNGTVYGSVTLQDDLEIKSGETLTVPDGSKLDCNEKLTNNGTILASGGTVTGSLRGGTPLTTPSISQQPQSTTVTEGSTAEFSITASDAQTYQWQRKATYTESEWENISDATTTSYTTADTTTDMSGYQYRCVVKSASGVSVTSAAATLTVEAYTPPTTYTISAVVTPVDAGTVTVNGSTSPVSIEANSTVNLVATPSSGYRFTGWTSSNVDVAFADPSSASTTFTMPADDVTVTANFEQYYTITVNASAGGTVDGGGDYAAGSSVTLKATANSGYRFVGWMEGDQTVSTDTTYAFPANSNRSLNAQFEKVYTVTVNASGGGTATGGGTYAVGDTVTLTATPDSGYHFDGWNIVSGTVTIQNNQFAMPAGNVEIQAIFDRNSSGGSSTPTKTPSQQATDKIEAAKDGSTVEIKLSTGSTKLDKEVFEELAGRDVTLEISLSNGVTWTVNGQDIPENAKLSDLDLGVTLDASTIPVSVVNTITGAVDTIQISLKHDGEFGFTMTLSAPLGKTNAGYWANLYYYNEDSRALEFQSADKIASDGTAEFAFSRASDYAIVIDTDSHEPVELPFTDVPEGAWYEDAAAYVYKHGLMAGTSATTFAPDVTTSRAMIATILWRMAGIPVVNYAMNYTDVTQGQWCSEAIRWATSEGVVTGYGNGLFGTNDPITREQLAAMLWRYAQTEGYDVSIGEDTNILSYTDVADLSEYAIPAMQWAVGTGIINGTGDGSTLTPQGQATRAQAAVMLMRFCEEYVVW